MKKTIKRKFPRELTEVKENKAPVCTHKRDHLQRTCARKKNTINAHKKLILLGIRQNEVSSHGVSTYIESPRNSSHSTA